VKLTTQFHLVPKSKNVWSYTSIPQYALMAWFSVKAQGQLPLPYNYYHCTNMAVSELLKCNAMLALLGFIFYGIMIYKSTML